MVPPPVHQPRPGSRTAVGFVVFFGVPLFGMMLARIVEIAYGRAKRIGLPAVVGEEFVTFSGFKIAELVKIRLLVKGTSISGHLKHFTLNMVRLILYQSQKPLEDCRRARGRSSMDPNSQGWLHSRLLPATPHPHHHHHHHHHHQQQQQHHHHHHHHHPDHPDHPYHCLYDDDSHDSVHRYRII